MRHGVARFDWEEATAARPTDLAQAIGDAFERSVRADLVRLGFTADEAARAFTFLPVQLRRVLRPQAIQDAVADKLKAQQDLERQQALTEVARIGAERRATEGLGVARLLDQVPQGFTPTQIAAV